MPDNKKRPDQVKQTIAAEVHPRFEATLAKIEALARPLGLSGWPSVVTDTGEEQPTASLEARFLENDRALIFVDKSHQRYSALVLLRVINSPDPGAEGRLCWVHDLFGEPTLDLARFGVEKPPGFGFMEVLSWKNGDALEQANNLRTPASNIHQNGPFTFVIGVRESDSSTTYLVDTASRLLVLIEGITDTRKNLEGEHPPGDVDFLQTIPRQSFQAAQKDGESQRFVWFKAGAEYLGALKSDWVLWRKGPRPAVILPESPP